MWWDTCLHTVVAKLTFTAGPQRRIDLKMVPLRINRQFQPVALESAAAAAAQRRLLGALILLQDGAIAENAAQSDPTQNAANRVTQGHTGYCQVASLLVRKFCGKGVD